MIIILNGCSSSGKSSIIKAVQHLSNKPFLNLGIDGLFSMMPDRYVKSGDMASEGFYFAKAKNGGLLVKNGPVGDLAIKTLPSLVKNIADSGLDVLVDEVIFEKWMMELYISTLKGHDVHIIAITCDLNIMIEREILRGNRMNGIALAQFELMQQFVYPYDMTIDTTHDSPFTCAKKILSFVNK